MKELNYAHVSASAPIGPNSVVDGEESFNLLKKCAQVGLNSRAHSYGGGGPLSDNNSHPFIKVPIGLFLRHEKYHTMK